MVLSLSYVTFYETRCSASTSYFFAIGQLPLSELTRVYRLWSCPARCNCCEIFPIVRISGYGKSTGASWSARSGVDGGSRSHWTASHGALAVLNVITVWGRRWSSTATMASTVHRGEYLSCVHRRFESIRGDKFDRPRVGSVCQKAAMSRSWGAVNRSGAVLRRVEASMALVLDRVHVYYQIRRVVPATRGNQHHL